MKTGSVWAVGLVVLLTAGLVLLAGGQVVPVTVSSAVASGMRATARSAVVDGREAGEVLVGDTVVMRIRTSDAGYTPYERARKVAERLDAALATGLRPSGVHAGMVDGEAVVLADRALLVTADAEQARLNGVTPMILAGEWASNVARALGGRPGSVTYVNGGSGSTPSYSSRSEWVPPEAYRDKIVPVLSIGEGRRIGAARVSGPTSQVDLVQAVATLETHYREVVEITAYVPISTKEPGKRLSRVQGCAVTALGDLGF